MAEPTNRAEFIQYCLRKLGHPQVQVAVTEEQLDDRVNDSLLQYWDYHFEGSDKEYYKYQITQTDIDNRYIIMPENVIGVVKIFNLGTAIGSNNIFSIRYQVALNDLYNLSNMNIVPYYMTMQHLQLMEEILIGQQPIRYNRNRNILYIDMDWSTVGVGSYLIAECYQIVDPEIFPDVWKDRWLKEYAVQLIKRQWYEPLTKYSGMSLPGGLQFNAQAKLDEAERKIEKLESELVNSYSLPANFTIG